MISKRSRVFSALLLLHIAVLAQTGKAPVPTGASSPTKIAVISVQNAIMATDDGRKEFQALDKKFEPQKSELKSLVDEIDRLKKQLDTQGSMMNDEARAGLAKQIESKQRALGRLQEDAQTDFGGQENEVAQRILKKLLPIIDKYAKDNGLSIIVDGSKSWPDWPVLWASPSIDITKAVVDAYNAQPASPAPASHQPIPDNKGQRPSVPPQSP